MSAWGLVTPGVSVVLSAHRCGGSYDGGTSEGCFKTGEKCQASIVGLASMLRLKRSLPRSAIVSC